MKRIITTLAIFTSLGAIAQNNVGIGTLTPNPNAKLEISSDDKGVLITRLTTISRNTLGTNLTAVEDGMLVYDKDLTAFYYWDGPNLQWVVVGNGSGTDDQNIDTFTFDNTTHILTIEIEDGNTQTVDLTNLLNDGDFDSTNEIELPATATTGQVLSWDGTNWVAQNSASGADNWGNDIVNTSGSNITGDGTTANPLIVTDGDSDATNEIELPTGGTSGQLLSTDGSGTYTWVNDNPGTDNQNIANLAFDNATNILTVGIDNGTSQNIDLSDLVNDADSDVTNEIQDLSITNNVLTITNNGSATTIDLSAYLDNTDAQTLTLTGNTLAISNGNSVTLVDNVNDADSDPANEIELPTGGTNGQVLSTNGSGTYTWVNDGTGTDNQDLSLTTNTLSLTNDGTTVDLSGYLDNTDAQNIAGSSFTTSTGDLVIGISNGTNQTINLNGLKDHNWYEVGTTRGADNINDNIFTQGNVAVGLSNPNARLDVNGDILYSGNTSTNLRITSLSDDIFLNMVKVSTGSTNAQIKFDGYGAPQDQGQIRFYTRWDPANGGAGTLNHVMSITEKGYVGIGTTTPLAKTHIYNQTGDTELIVEADPSNTDENDNPEIILIQDNGLIKGSLKMLDGNNIGFLGTSIVNRTNQNALVFNTFTTGVASQSNGKIDFATLDTVRMSINAKGGNVGIGIPSPGAKLHVKGDVGIYPTKAAIFEVNSTSPTFKDQVSIVGNLNSMTEPYGIAFLGDNHHRGGMYALNRGGTSNSEGELHLWARGSGNVVSNNDFRVGLINPINSGTLPNYGNRLYFSGGPSPAGYDSENSDPLWFARYNLTSDKSELRLNVGDNNQVDDAFSIGYSNGGYNERFRFGMTGVASKPGGGTWAATSDRRTKKDIVNFSDGLNVLTQINPVTFKYNGLYNTVDDGTDYVGIVAQEVKSIAPYMIGSYEASKAIGGNKEEILNYDGGTYMLYVLVNSVKEQQEEIKEQQEEIKGLKKELTSQKEVNKMILEKVNLLLNKQ